MPVYDKRPGFQRTLSGEAYVAGDTLAQRVMVQNNTQFDEVLTASRSPIIELNSSYGTSILRDLETVTGSGSVSSTGGEILLSTGATATSSSKVRSAEVGRYIPGYGAELGVGIRIPTDPTGNQVATWGGISPDGNDGFYFGKDATGLYIAYISGGTETITRQSNWNIDTLDGNGISGFNLDTSNGNIYQIDFTWYGYGQILFGIMGIPPAPSGTTVDDGYRYNQSFIPVHSLKINGSTSVESPNIMVFAEADNGGDATDFDLYVGGRQYSIIGNYKPKFRFTGDNRTGVSTSTTVVPLISFQRKSAFSDRSIKLASYDVIATTEPCILEIRLDGTLTGSSFGTPTNHIAAETAVESDTSATAISGGHVLWTGLAQSGGNRNTSVLSQQDVDFDLPNGSVVTLCARTISGTGTIETVFRVREEW